MNNMDIGYIGGGQDSLGKEKGHMSYMDQLDAMEREVQGYINIWHLDDEYDMA